MEYVLIINMQFSLSPVHSAALQSQRSLAHVLRSAGAIYGKERCPACIVIHVSTFYSTVYTVQLVNCSAWNILFNWKSSHAIDLSMNWQLHMFQAPGYMLHTGYCVVWSPIQIGSILFFVFLLFCPSPNENNMSIHILHRIYNVQM